MINPDVHYIKKGTIPGTDPADTKPQYRCFFDHSGVTCGMMLNTDFGVFYNMTLAEDTFLATCDPHPLDFIGTDCELAPTYSKAAAYAEDNDLWIKDYVTVYDIMTS